MSTSNKRYIRDESQKYRCSVIHAPESGEDWKERHQRRLERALEDWPKIREWARYRGVECGMVRDGSGCVTFRLKVHLHKSAAVAGWIPSKGRAWRNSDCCRRQSVYSKVHDYTQFINELTIWHNEIKRA